MEFEDMQVIWNNQNEEKLFAINEDALYDYIKRKGKSINWMLGMVEWMMMVVNIVVGIVLIIDAVQDYNGPLQVGLAAMYIAYAGVGVARRLLRRRAIVHFEPTMLGELDKAIWQVEYLIRQGRSLIIWYLLPLLIVAALTMALNDKPLWAAGVFILLPFAYLATNWEINKWHLPKKRSLLALRAKLVDSDGPAMDLPFG